PVSDIVGVYRWVMDELPTLADSRGLSVAPSSIVAVGWSSGGHLAMALDWMSRFIGLPTPKAILAFYPPVTWAGGCKFDHLENKPSELATHIFPAIHASSTRNLLTHESQGMLKTLVRKSDRNPVSTQHSYRTPTFIISGLDDGVVPSAASDEFCDALLAASVPFQVLSVPVAGHTFNYCFKCSDEAWKATI
ncbi:Alpha/Beta hydrolase protein, partial [Colletotrichum cereale]